MATTVVSPRPFIHWVGGKKQLLPIILDKLNTLPPITRYIEPFIGGGAVFFAVEAKRYIINDMNEELINAYQCVKNYPQELILQLKELEDDYYRLHTDTEQETFYLQVRNLDRSPTFKQDLTEIMRAVRFIFITKIGYNGLYRVNRAGLNNTPFGHNIRHNKKPTICDAPTIIACSQKLARTDIYLGSYEALIPSAKKTDVWFFDPPYIPLVEEKVETGTQKDYVGYTKEGFSIKDQWKLVEHLHTLDRKGVKFLLTNHNAPLAQELYRGFNIQPIMAKRSISSDASGRGATLSEILVSNF